MTTQKSVTEWLAEGPDVIRRYLAEQQGLREAVAFLQMKQADIIQRLDEIEDEMGLGEGVLPENMQQLVRLLRSVVFPKDQKEEEPIAVEST